MTEAKAEPVVAPPVIPTTPEGIREYLEKKSWWFEVPWGEVRSRHIGSKRLRLDADYYSASAIQSRSILGALSKTTEPLDSLAQVYTLGRFKRVYTRDPTKGHPYLQAEEVFAFRPTSEGNLAKKYAPTAEGHFAKEGWLLMSSSGSVGNLIYVTKMMEKYFLTHDLARIIPREDVQKPVSPGYLWAYLASPMFQAIVKPYGAVVPHIEAEHLQDLPVPRLSDGEEARIDSMVRKAWELRDEANRLLDEAVETTEELIRNRAAKVKDRRNGDKL